MLDDAGGFWTILNLSRLFGFALFLLIAREQPAWSTYISICVFVVFASTVAVDFVKLRPLYTISTRENQG